MDFRTLGSHIEYLQATKRLKEIAYTISHKHYSIRKLVQASAWIFLVNLWHNLNTIRYYTQLESSQAQERKDLIRLFREFERDI